ncbi:MAG: hydrogenase nickel incorporation protein HypB [Candidatus Omnitrophota bacterium]
METQRIRVYRDLMGANDEWAQKTRTLLREKNLVLLNIIGSAGCGKTTLLEKTVQGLKDRVRFAVLEGDIETTRDAERLAPLGIPVSQLLTSGACHLEAKLVHYGLRDFPLDKLDVVLVENVGNLVCPAEFDIGEDAKVAVLSVTEGEDKPLKYPLLFREAKALVLSKMDLLPYLPFSLQACLEYVHRVNATLPIFQISSLQSTGFKEWFDWLCLLINP